MTHHTRGPWITDGRIVWADPDRDGNECIVAISGMANSPKNTADAVLIAAAPELLDALESILNLPVEDNGERVIPAGYLDAARAAIAKATSP